MKFTRNRYKLGSLTIEARPSGNEVWIYRYRQVEDGKRINRKIVVGTKAKLTTRSAAQKEIEGFRLELNRETSAAHMKLITVRELVAHYKLIELGPDSEKTHASRENSKLNLNNHILPQWELYPVNEVKSVAVELWLKNLKKRDGGRMSNGTKSKIRNLMSAVFRHGQRYEWLSSNPIRLVRQSAKREKTPEVLEVFEMVALLKQLKNPYRSMVFVAATTGVRVSELLGMRWSDVDLERGLIGLKRGVVQGVQRDALKNNASQKPVPLDEGIATCLAEWKAEAPYSEPGDWIWASPFKKGRKPYWRDSALKNHVQPAAVRAGIHKNIGWHTLRHSYVTFLSANGESIKTMQELARHASSKITLDVYAQAMSDTKRQAQKKVVEMLLGVRVKPAKEGERVSAPDPPLAQSLSGASA